MDKRKMDTNATGMGVMDNRHTLWSEGVGVGRARVLNMRMVARQGEG